MLRKRDVKRERMRGSERDDDRKDKDMGVIGKEKEGIMKTEG